MNLTKLTDTIADLKTLRAAIDPAIDHLEQAVAALKGLGITAPEIISTFSLEPVKNYANSNGHRAGSHFDNAIKVLEASGSPMHIVEITKLIGELSRKEVGRASVDGAISRHIREVKPTTISRFGAGMYGLTAWKNKAKQASRRASSTREGPTRKEILTKFIREIGPMKRTDLIDNTGIPPGTIAHCLTDKDTFRQLSDGRWDVVPPPPPSV